MSQSILQKEMIAKRVAENKRRSVYDKTMVIKFFFPL